MYKNRYNLSFHFKKLSRLYTEETGEDGRTEDTAKTSSPVHMEEAPTSNKTNLENDRKTAE